MESGASVAEEVSRGDGNASHNIASHNIASDRVASDSAVKNVVCECDESNEEGGQAHGQHASFVYTVAPLCSHMREAHMRVAHMCVAHTRVCPPSYGVGYNGPDFTDMHHLKPSSWSINAARGNKLFGRCDAESIEEDECNRPAYSPNDENKEMGVPTAAADTESDKERWLPPANVRGDIARAMFYMDVRYDGSDDPDSIDLQLSNCPSKPNSDGR